MSSQPIKIAIIGGGICGLSAGHRILERNPEADVTVYEQRERLGGVIQSTQRDGFLVEHSADSFIVSPELPWAGELCKKLNVELIKTSQTGRGAAILRNGRLHAVPEGLHLMSIRRYGPLLQSPLLSWPGKIRVLAERFVPPPKNATEESLEQFTHRRYGREMFERIVQPLVGGIYTADPRKLSMAAALPQFVTQERTHGSLHKAAVLANRRQPHEENERGARYGLFRSPRHGMQTLISALEARLHEQRASLRMPSTVKHLERRGDQWQVTLIDQTAKSFDGIVLATPMRAVSKLVSTVHPELAGITQEIECVSTAITCLGFHSKQLKQPLSCFGSVIPHAENRKILAVSHSSVKFPDRAPAEHVLLRVFTGGALQPELASLDDDELIPLVLSEVASIMGITGEPTMAHVVRWPLTTPQYNLGHRERIQSIRNAIGSMPNVAIANNALEGVGIPQCVRAGWEAADAVLETLAPASH